MLGDFRSFAQTDNSGKILRSRAPLALVASTVNQRLQQRSFPDVQSSRPLRRVELVPGYGKGVATNLLNVDGNFSPSLHGIPLQEHVGFPSDSPHLFP